MSSTGIPRNPSMATSYLNTSIESFVKRRGEIQTNKSTNISILDRTPVKKVNIEYKGKKAFSRETRALQS